MRFLLTIVFVFAVFLSIAQPSGKIQVSGTVVDVDSFPVQGAAIINVKTGKLIHTDKDGHFMAEFSEKDSLLIYHIAYKKQFINSTDPRKKFVMEPEVHELKQVNVTDKGKSGNKNLDSMMISASQLAQKKKLTGYDEKSQLDYFVDQNGSHNKGFSPYFGPSFGIPFGKSLENVLKREERRQRKEMTSHYHLVESKK